MAQNFTTQTKWHKVWSRLMMIINDFIVQWRHFSFTLAFYNTMWWIGNYFPPLRRLQFMAMRRITSWMDKYLSHHYPTIISRLEQAPMPTPDQYVTRKDYFIWVFWWQGEESMPELVRSCYRQLLRNNNNVILITKDNFQSYCNIPQSVVDKVEAGIITFTSFSDIIRVSLLAAHGGYWLDSTCWVTQELPDEVYNQAIWSTRTMSQAPLPMWSNSRWCGYSLGTNLHNNPPFVFMKDLMCAVVTDKLWPFYSFIDYLYDFAYRKNAHVKAMFDAIPENNVKRNQLHLKLNTPFNQSDYQALCADTWVFKLSYKTPWRARTADGQLTYYGYLCTQDTN